MPATTTNPTTPNAATRPTPTPCTHCTLPVPRALIDPNSDTQFCCSACRTVYETIHACNLETYYRLRDLAAADPQPATHAGRAHAEFDDPAFKTKHAKHRPDALHEIELYLESVHCAACVWLVERLPQLLEGVADARLDLGRALVTIRWDDTAVPLSKIARTLDALGYPPHPAKGRAARLARQAEDRRAIIRIAAAAACAGNIMLLSFALYSGMFSGMQHAFETFFRVASMVIGLVALAWPAAPFFRGALGALRARRLSLDLPIAIGLAIGGLAGTINTIRGSGEIYFDSIAMLIFLLLVGRWVQRRQQQRAAGAVEMLYSLTPTSARLVTPAPAPNDIQEVPIEAIHPGDIVEVLAGDSIPVDGIVTHGTTDLDASMLTGESRPVPVRPESTVHAGAVNLAATIRVRATAAGDDSRLTRLMDEIERLATRRSRIVSAADRVAGWFVGAVVTLAAITLAVWTLIDPARAIDNAIALLIVTCPCALALATPLAATVAIGTAARRGILIKGADALERLAAPATLLLDKTGTITAGRLALADYTGDDSLLPLAAALEATSAHPIARAIAAAVGPEDRPAPDHAEQIPSRGIIGRVNDTDLAIGAHDFITERTGPLPAWAEQAIADATSRALTPILIAANGELRAVAAIGDAPRPDAAEAIATLKRAGWTIGVLSGDHTDVVRAIARDIGLDDTDLIRGDLAPEDKLAIIEQLRTRGPVVMVGDGVNDAAALAEADVGIAVHAGAEASLAAADISLRRPGLAPLTDLIAASKRTVAVIHRNIAISLAYNAVAASLAIAGLISPIAAAIIMPASSFTVLTLSLQSRPFRAARAPTTAPSAQGPTP